MAELGAGGGKGDLDQQHELEVGDVSALGMLMSLCATHMQDRPKLLGSVMEILASIMRDPVRTVPLDFAALHPEQRDWNPDDLDELGQMPLDSLIPALVSLATKAGEQIDLDTMIKTPGRETKAVNGGTSLPTQIVSVLPSWFRNLYH